MKKYFVLQPKKIVKQISLQEFKDYSDEYYGESDFDVINKLIQEELYEKLGLNTFKDRLSFKYYIADEESLTVRLYDLETFLNIKINTITEICK